MVFLWASEDMHMVFPGKFLAFRGPCDDGSHGSLPALHFVEVFKSLGVAVIIRLNHAEYDKSTFVEAGFVHEDLFFKGEVVQNWTACLRVLIY